MESQVLVIKADQVPQPGVENPTSNQIYKNVRMFIEERHLKPLQPGHIRVKPMYIGVCGTDVHLTTNHPETGYITCSAPLSIPAEGRVIGHEGVGQVLEVGANVTHIQPGMVVAFESIIVCNQCPVCKKGKFNQCKNAKLLGLEKDGLLGTIVDVPASIAHDMTEYIRSEEDFIAAANIEPAAVAFVGCENASIVPGEKVVVFGAGPIGIFSAMLCKSVFGASEVHVIEPNEFRREFARRWADHVYDVEAFFEDNIAEIDVIIETSADLDNVTRVFRRINANGRVVLLGRKGLPLHIRQVDHMITNEIAIRGSRGHLCGAFQQVMRLHKAKRINLTDIVTKKVTGIREVMKLLQTPEIIEQHNCKVVVDLTAKPFQLNLSHSANAGGVLV